MNPDIKQLADLAVEFWKKLEAVKASIGPQEFDWYPYYSLGVFPFLDQLLKGERRYLLDLAGHGPILDVGCADGDLSFFFESLGFRVHAVDCPATNYNQMRGVAVLRSAMQSCVELYPANLDEQFQLPEENYGLALFLGILYHLKNPFYALEALSRRAAYCLLSTRVAQWTPQRRTEISREPLAYLLGEGEANEDRTNYWIFSEAGLNRVLRRSGWEICDFMTAGCTEGSDPVNPEGDERAYCLLRSRRAVFGKGVQLLSGWHELENSWRWTARTFSVLLIPAANIPPTRLEFQFSIPDAVIRQAGSLTLSASVNGIPLIPQTYSQPGDHAYIQRLPAVGPSPKGIRVDFHLDKAITPSGLDQRELGVLVSFLGPGDEARDSNLPLRLT